MFEVMATPIKETPILTGEDARRFIQRMENVKPVSKEELDRMKKNYEFMRGIADFYIPECKL